jgi:hypothetical protein
MAEIAWTEEAQRWLEDIFEYIAADNPAAAARTESRGPHRPPYIHREVVKEIC